MSFRSRTTRTNEHDQSNNLDVILLEKQVRHAGTEILPLKIFKFKDLSLATNGFTNFKMSSTYHGYFKPIIDGVQVVLKKPNLNSPFGDLRLNEITILSSIRHRNIIKLLGCCLEVSSDALVVYEFIPNGNLHDLISSQIRLPWLFRLRIATGIAEALAYLHHYGERPIIHRDVKPDNVHMDKDYNPKLGGFYFAVSKPKDEDRSNSIRRAGTYVYLDPEYHLTGVPTEKIDVYSFGVLLLVLFSWQLPSYRYEEQLSLKTFRSKLEFLGLDLNKDDSLFGVVINYFPIANADIILEEVGGRREQSVAFLRLVCRCLNGRGEFRPTMKEAVRELKRMMIEQQMELQDYDV